MSIVIREETVLEDFDSEDQNISLLKDEEGGGGHTTDVMENEKRLRREIANSNERRRMQSINAGFQSLRILLPHHEGEKLSKAAILQQTAQYISALEREKTELLLQNCQLKRLIDQNDGNVIDVVQPTQNGTQPAAPTQIPQQQTGTAFKKRKLDTIYTMQAISDSSDEGLGSMSPEPTVTLLSTQTNGIQTNTVTTKIAANTKEFIELKNILEAEKRKNLALEERIRQLTECHQVCDRVTTYQQHEVIEHTDNLRHEDAENIHTVVVDNKIRRNLHLLPLDSFSTIDHSLVVCEEADIVDGVNGIHHVEHIDNDDDSRTMSPCNVKEEYLVENNRPETPVLHHTIHLNSNATTVRLQPILEAAIKAEPKVEVERINSPNSITVLQECKTLTDGSTITITTNGHSTSNNNRSSRSRQNLETIVEAIRHLEGDQMFGEMIEPTQDAPLALTNKPQRQLQNEMVPFLHFRTTSSSSPSSIAVAVTNASSASAVSSSASINGLQNVSQITTHQHSPLLHAQLQHPKCMNLSSTSSAPTLTTTPSSISSPSIITHITHPQHSINNRPGVIVVKQNS